MKLRLLVLGLMMSQMMSLMSAAAVAAAASSAPEGESVDEIIAKVNNDTVSSLLEGDVLVDTRRNAVIGARKWRKYRGRVSVRFYLSSSYSSSQKNQIRSVLKTIEARTCVRFRELSRFWSRFIRHLYIYSGSGCSSYIGRQSGWRRGQRLSLSKSGCLTTAIIQHEILHALGFAHEHSRSDRDDYVRVLYDNIEPDALKNFQKHRTNNLNTPYDFNSVMQYGNNFFSKNGRPTLESIRNPGLQFGRATSMSSNDFLRVNRLYSCKV